MKFFSKIRFHFFKGVHPTIFTLDEFREFVNHYSNFYVWSKLVVYQLDYMDLKMLRFVYLKKVDKIWQIYASTKTSLKDFKIAEGHTSIEKSIQKLYSLFDHKNEGTRNRIYSNLYLETFEHNYIKKPLIKKIVEDENISNAEIEDFAIIFKDLSCYKSHNSGYIHLNSFSNKNYCSKTDYSPLIGFIVELKFSNDEILEEVRHLEENLKILHKDYVMLIKYDSYKQPSLLIYKNYRSQFNLFI